MEVWLNPVRSASRNDLLILLSFFHSSLFLAYRILPCFFALIVNPHPLLHFILHFIVSVLFFFSFTECFNPLFFLTSSVSLLLSPPGCFITSVCTCMRMLKKKKTLETYRCARLDSSQHYNAVVFSRCLKPGAKKTLSRAPTSCGGPESHNALIVK